MQKIIEKLFDISIIALIMLILFVVGVYGFTIAGKRFIKDTWNKR